MTATEPLTNLSGGLSKSLQGGSPPKNKAGVAAQLFLPVPVLAEERESCPIPVGPQQARESTKEIQRPDSSVEGGLDSRGGQNSLTTENERLCPDCESREIAPTEDLCVICWFARNDENPDGRWVNTDHAGWLYE